MSQKKFIDGLMCDSGDMYDLSFKCLTEEILYERHIWNGTEYIETYVPRIHIKNGTQQLRCKSGIYHDMLSEANKIKPFDIRTSKSEE